MNNWYVVTGGPCSGKTTTLQELRKKGYFIVEEAARTYIDSELKNGKTLKEIRNNELLFQKKVLKLKHNIESKIPKNKVTIFERGIPDSIAYFSSCGVTDINILKKIGKESFYKKVFLFELLKYKKDYARTESFEKAQEITSLLEQSYRMLDIEIIRVPVMSLKKRVQFIIDNI